MFKKILHLNIVVPELSSTFNFKGVKVGTVGKAILVVSESPLIIIS